MNAVNINMLIEQVVYDYRTILGDDLVGIYLHGSLAFGCFNPEKSDIDFIAVVNKPLTINEKTALITSLLALDPKAPTKGFEMSVVLRSVCKPFIYPTPYELHFSNSHKERYIADLTAHCERLHGCDPDLAAHFTVIRTVGKTLYGEPIDEVFGEVPTEYYLDSILKDVESAKEDILRDPVYMILNLCRVLGYLQGGGVMSKKAGGEWGIANLSEYRDVIESALREYSGIGGIRISESELLEFAEDILTKIYACICP